MDAYMFKIRITNTVTMKSRVAGSAIGEAVR